jgi:hypothetical protein
MLRVSPLVVVLAFVLTIVGFFLGLMLVVGCSENLHPNTDRTRVCESMRAWDGLKYWLVVLSPALVLLASQAFPWFRRHPLLATTAIVLVIAPVWTYLLLVVSSNIGDTTISS